MFYAFLSCSSPQVVDFPPIEASGQIRPQHVFTSSGDATTILTPGAINEVNTILGSRSGFLFSCDFEWALFNNSGNETTDSIKTTLAELQVNVDGTIVDIARRLGSKVNTGRAADHPKKQPHIRARIAEDLPLDALPPEIFALVRAIFLKALGSEAEVRALLASAGVAVNELNQTIRHRRSIVAAAA